ncbi:MAG: hypothetical protein HY296_06195 [Thaumarchaeota archaeon]|nr:hypothetical protein [Nitrososphaerota archaeon]
MCIDDDENGDRFKREVRLSNPDFDIIFHNEHPHKTEPGKIGFTPDIYDKAGNRFRTHFNRGTDY